MDVKKEIVTFSAYRIMSIVSNLCSHLPELDHAHQLGRVWDHHGTNTYLGWTGVQVCVCEERRGGI